MSSLGSLASFGPLGSISLGLVCAASTVSGSVIPLEQQVSRDIVPVPTELEDATARRKMRSYGGRSSRIYARNPQAGERADPPAKGGPKRGDGRVDGSLPKGPEMKVGTDTPGTTSPGLVITECTVPRTAALTFDDGPYLYTEREEISRILKENDAVGTFFFNGQNFGCINEPGNAARVKAAYDAGHQVASHTWSHKDLATLSHDEAVSEMASVTQAIQDIIKVRPAFMRPPYGSYSDLAVAAAAEVDQDIVLWNLDSGDSVGAPPSESQSRYHQAAQQKSPILSLNHETHETTVNEVLPAAIKTLKEAGYRLVSVAECVGKEPYLKDTSKSLPKSSLSCGLSKSTCSCPRRRLQAPTTTFSRPMNSENSHQIPHNYKMDNDDPHPPLDLMTVDELSEAVVTKLTTGDDIHRKYTSSSPSPRPLSVNPSYQVESMPLMECPDLPLEVVYKILDIYWVDEPHSLDLSLVTRKWMWYIRGDRFRVIALRPSEILSFLQLVKSPVCTLTHAVKTLQLSPYSSTQSSSALPLIARSLPGLESLHLDAHDLPFNPTLLSSDIPNVETVIIRRMYKGLGGSYPEFISRFSSIKKLVLEEIPHESWHPEEKKGNAKAIQVGTQLLPNSLTDLTLTHPTEGLIQILLSSPSTQNLTKLSFHFRQYERTIGSVVRVLQSVGSSLTDLTLQIDHRDGGQLRKNIWDFTRNINLATLTIKGTLSYAPTRQAWIIEILDKVSPLRQLIFSIHQLTRNGFQRYWSHADLASVFKRRPEVFGGLEELVYVARGGNDSWGKLIKGQVEASFSSFGEEVWKRKKVLRIEHEPAMREPRGR
ncbi:hypothetical protein NP233_g1039 [Leucocoprinus birnbaumii]|uniref:NodB homology domain-containing protein n=1 Tax=Leucocoprinus birnbaumii TaxID=56174 RepID=A0AAD5W1T5_9AGAR|nr:hypothetical protein NP233_g1039 [Leucocoprinus birnbaumii]